MVGVYWGIIGFFVVLAAGTIGVIYFRLCKEEDTSCFWEDNGYIEEDEHLADIVKGFEKDSK